jgi:hypothetical protein
MKDPITQENQELGLCRNGTLTPIGPLEPDTAHQPSLTYLAYILTGDKYYLDETQFWGNYNVINTRVYEDPLRGQGIIANNQVR